MNNFGVPQQPSMIPMRMPGSTMPHQPNHRYKTAICRHFETTGTCQMGERCHFAHGPGELRVSNNRPVGGIGGIPGVSSGGVSNYKTVPCKFWSEDGACNFGDKCSFAHGT